MIPLDRVDANAPGQDSLDRCVESSSLVHDVGSTSAAKPPPRENFVVYWHLLSLDAPTVAMLWTGFIARCSGIRLPVSSILAMGVAVWLLYAADRLLDARIPSERSSRDLCRLQPRHHFHRRHRKAFRAGIAFASVAIVYLSISLARPSIRLYTLLAAPLFVYFLLIHQREDKAGKPAPRFPKEIAVGVLFSAATFIPTVARSPELRAPLLSAALLFGALCSLNCLFIYAWEHPLAASTARLEAHSVSRLALRFLPHLATLTVAGASVVALVWGFHVHSQHVSWQLAAAIALAAALLLGLNASRHLFDANTLRATADLCLLTPILFLLTLRP